MTTTEASAPDRGDQGPAGRGPVPLTILTGFLGAGKTTLLNRVLAGDHGLRIAVLVNDFGAVNIDAELVVGVDDEMVSLANGCVCCEIRDDLVAAVDRVLAAPEPADYLVLEASGVADPMGIYATFADARHRDRIRLDTVTCVVDAEQVHELVERTPEVLPLVVRQIGSADLVLLNKADLVGREVIAWLRTWIDQMMNRARIIETTYCDVPWAVLLSTDREIVRFAGDEPSPDEHAPDGHDHGAQFDRWLFESTDPLSISALEEFVRRRLSGEIYRLKGFVHAIDDPDHRYVLHTVGRRIEIRRFDPWGDQTPSTRLVAIGAAGSPDWAALDNALVGCTASRAAS